MDLGALVRRLVAGPSGAGDAAASGSSSEAASGSSGKARAAGPSIDPPARPAWRYARPIQRVVGSAPLVAPSAPFSAQLATARPAPLALAPLGHDRGLEAPAGLVAGIAAPVRRSPASPMPASVRTAHDARPATRAAVQRSSDGSASPDDGVSGDVAPADAVPAQSGVALEEAPPRGAASAGVAPVAAPSPLVTAPSPVAGLVGLIGRAAVASVSRSSPMAASAVAGSDAPSVGRSVAGDPARASTASTPTVAQAARAPSVPSTSVTDRPVRRIRLGAPLTPTVSRMAIQGSSAAASSSLASSATLPPAPGPLAAPGPSAPGPSAPSGVSAPAAETLATAALATSGTSAPADPMQPAASPGGMASSNPSPAPARLQRSATRAPARSPLVGGLRPVLTPASSAISVLRRAVPEAEIEGDAVGAGSSAEALAAVGRPDWAAAGAGWAPSQPSAMTAGAGSLGGPGSPFAIEPGQGGISPARLTWTNPLADDPSAPSAGAGPDPMAARLAAGAALPSMPWAAASTSATSAPAATPASAPASASSSPTVSRSSASRPAAPRGGLRVGPAMTGADVAGAAGRPASLSSVRPSFPSRASASPAVGAWDPEPVVARAVTIDEVEVAPGPSTASGESGPAAGASAPAGGGGGGAAQTAAAGAAGAAGSEAARDQETQAWADRLYDRIALRLRRDLLVERERSGALVDRGF